ncbi:MAG TPA: hypothetical protein VGQ42_15300 [Candidatus Dormibacteraeota bacterium]|nr:hypothetical protein [Candidatus Dormibacteraeota bacterium]
MAAEAWLAQLSTQLPRHHEVLQRLVEGVRREPRVVQLSIGCSVVRGTGDELSDLDVEMSLEPEAWPSGLDLVEPLLRSAGEVVDVLHHHMEGAPQGRRTAAIYAGGVQVDLMVWPVTVWSGMHPANTVILHATRQVFTRPWDPAAAAPSAAQVHEWYFLGWWALLDADKYLRRGSAWEARQRLEEARTAAWRLAAAAQGLPHPEYGVTTLLDAPAPQLPPGAEATATDVDLDALRTAVQRCADFLDAQWAQAPSPIATWARQRLTRAAPHV